MANQQVCIGGDLYEIVPDSTTSSGTIASGGTIVTPQGTNTGMSITETELTQLVNMFGGGTFGGGYRSVLHHPHFRLDRPSQRGGLEPPQHDRFCGLGLRPPGAGRQRSHGQFGSDIFRRLHA